MSRSAVPLAEHLLTSFVFRTRRFWAGLGERETASLADRLLSVKVDSPIYITGLARAGTTILLRTLAEFPGVATHRYRDFPLLFTPYWHSRFLETAGGHGGAPLPRAQEDGIMVSPESPEAFEEVLWRHFFPPAPGASPVLDESASHPAFERFYGDHLKKLILARGGSRYAAKANYHVTRLRYLAKLYPQARFLIVVRHPVSHVASLMRQDRLFRERFAADRRALFRLEAVGHFEFGPLRRPIALPGVEAVMRHWAGGDEAAGWAEYWRLIHAHLAGVLRESPAVRESALVVRHEDLCRSPGPTIERIAAHCALEHPEGLVRRLSGMIHSTVSQGHHFSAAQEKAVLEATAAVAEIFGYTKGERQWSEGGS